MLSVLFERNFQQIAKLIPAKHKKSPIRKIKLPQKFSATRYLPVQGQKSLEVAKDLS